MASTTMTPATTAPLSSSSTRPLLTAEQKMVKQCSPFPFAETSAELYMNGILFPVAMLIAHFVIILRMWSAQNQRNAGRITLVFLGCVALAMFWVYIPQAMAPFEVFYTSETFRRFYFAVQKWQTRAINFLSGLDSYLTLLICVEFSMIMKNSRTKALLSTPMRRAGVYGVIGLISAVGAIYAFIAPYQTAFLCNGTRMVTFARVTKAVAELMTAWQWVFVAVVIAAPCLLLVINNGLMACAAAEHERLPTEANELIEAPTKSANNVRKLRLLLAALTACFVVPHLLSIVPLLVEEKFTRLSIMALTNAVLFAGRVATYSLLHIVSAHLAKMGIVHVY